MPDENPSGLGPFEFPMRFPGQYADKYVPEVNEYQLEHMLKQGGKTFVVLYHCSFCGGAAPESKRGDLFSKISDQEAARLRSLTEKVKSGADAPV